MFVIQPLLIKTAGKRANELRIPLNITKTHCTMCTQLKASGGVEIQSPIGSRSGVSELPTHYNLRPWAAYASLPEYRLGFSGFLKTREVEHDLRSLRAFIQPEFQANMIFDSASSPLAIFAPGLITAGILLELDLHTTSQGHGHDLFIEGEILILDTRLDSEFLRCVNLEHLNVQTSV